MPDIIALGECMVELYSDEPVAVARTFHKTLGGDTFNLVAMAHRLGSTTGYITKVGDDPFGEFLLDSFGRLGVDASHAPRVSGVTGVYFVTLSSGGQREFLYYRQGSAPSTMTPKELDPEYIGRAKLLHSSGISQALSSTCRATVLRAFELAKALGVQVSFDPNLRLRLWRPEEAQAALEEVLPHIDILLPSAPQEIQLLLGTASPEEAIRLLWQRGVSTVVVKEGEQGCVVGAQGQITRFAALAATEVVDTTGAGDAFNGAFLHGLVQGLSPWEAARLAIVASSLKCAGRGAIDSQPSREQVEAALQKTPRWPATPA